MVDKEKENKKKKWEEERDGLIALAIIFFLLYMN